MIIDITELNQNFKDAIVVSTSVSFPSNYLEDTQILGVSGVYLEATLSLNEERNLELLGTLSGEMKIADSISLEEVEYPFSIEIEEIFEENAKKCENTLDILDVLWQNIVLEVPLRFTKVKDVSKFQGDGWRLLEEDVKNESNNPFADLKDYFGEE